MYVGYSFYQQKNGLYPVPQEVVDAACADAWARFPEESCGVVYEDKYLAMPNVHEAPKDHWRINIADYQEEFLQYGEPQAIIHSHPRHQHYPSVFDMQSQIDTRVTYGIIVIDPKAKRIDNVLFWGDKVKVAPQEGRPFVHGVYDCYGMVRDQFYTDFGLWLPNYSRAFPWWEANRIDNLILENFGNAGFSPVEINSAKRGDVLIGSLLATGKTNHCAYYLGNGEIVHHIFGTPEKPRLSKKDIIYPWKRFISHCLRHQSQI